MQALKNLLSPLSGNSNPIQDTLKLVVIGGTVETARRASVSAWNGFIDSFFLTAHFSQEDYPYDWLMHWLSKAGQPAWGRSREFDITTRSVSRHGLTQKTTGDLEDENEEEENSEFQQGGGRRRKVAIVPSMDTTHTIYYRGHWLRITRTKRFQDYGSCAELKISVVARNNDILKRLVLEAKREYEKDAEHRVHIFMADTTYGCWRWNGARQKRPMSSIVLEPGVKDMILADCKDFLSSEDWCVAGANCLTGIPFRRGYLLHGVPGSGKTSLIHSLAGELGLDIYVVSLSSKGMSDNTLTTLMGNVPSRCILLLEDLDAAFTRGISRDETSTGAPTGSSSTSSSSSKSKEKDDNDGSTLSLSGLLNSLDGVAAAEGRLLFATTNHIERLDPALSRPGRMDVWVNFKHATKWQAEGIFKCFFPARPSSTAATSAPKSAADADASTAAKGAKHPADATSAANLAESKRKRAAHSVPLLSEEEISDLARRFADAIPENELSVAALQGYLLRNKTRPRECVDEVAAWVVSEREMREKLKKEKEEREAKEKKEAEEKAKKEVR
ncbi:P-loop containing nucleoside triphosphate hydrolase protein [Pilatotrama ljubarskyi]|nr:P-loop containing nucleoside triphosphate hydrolase protein [Pilatotrama ljubarskyi]